MSLNDTIVNLGGMSCQYDKLPAICQELIPKYDDIAFKYNLIIIVGLLNILAMTYFAFLIRRYINAKKKELGVSSITELLKKK